MTVLKHTIREARKYCAVLWVGGDAAAMELCAHSMEWAEFHYADGSIPLARAAAGVDLVLIDTGHVTGDIAAIMAEIHQVPQIPTLVMGRLERDCGENILLPSGLPACQIAAYAAALLCQHEDMARQEDGSGTFPAVAGDFFVDRLDCWASVRGSLVTLPEYLCRALVFFLRNPLRLITYQEMTNVLWFACGAYGQDEQAVIRELCSKIEPDPENPVYLCEIPGRGYRFYPQRAST